MADVPDEPEIFEADKPRVSTRPAKDRSAKVALVNAMSRRTGCTLHEARVTLEGKSLPEQEALAATGRPDLETVRALELEALLGKLRAAKIDPDSVCPFGAPKGGTHTWGDVAARLVYQGRGGDLGKLLERVA